MRHKTSLNAEYFEQLFTKDPDPWAFETSDYERAKYDHTLKSLPKPRFRRVLEIGCANGALTERLAERCDRLIAVDVVEQAVTKARQRCSAMTNVTVRKASIPEDQVEGPFDLILLSEVAYYWDSDDIKKAAAYFRDATEAGGHLMLVHWTGETDYPKSGDEAVTELKAATESAFIGVRRERHPKYRLDLWRRTDER
jgi:cyclopropane fatty-acyl-phospholipid synthase-like methyltransferase